MSDRLFLLWMGSDSENWPSVEGTVQSLAYRPIGMGRSGDGWHLTVDYTYSVEGRVYTSDRLRFAKGFAGLDEKKMAVAREQYAEGARITVYHHPRRPSLSVLIPGVGSHIWMGLILGLVLLLVAAVFWLVPTRSGGDQRSASRQTKS